MEYCLNKKHNKSKLLSYSGANDKLYEIDFEKMVLNKPEEGHLERIWQPGLYVQYRTSTNLTSLKCSIFKIQIDNQLPDAYFPISFYKAPTNLNEKKLIPFVILDLFTEQQEVTQIYRYFNCLLQEFYLKIDKGFLFSLKDWYDAAVMVTSTEDQMFSKDDEEEVEEPLNILLIVDSDKQTIENINNDIKLSKEIMEYINQAGNVKQSAIIRFDDFQLSPILFNLSFSVNGNVHTDDKEIKQTSTDFILNFFLESIGSTITEFKDIKFQFGEFEIDNHTKTWNELYDDIFNHYKIQALHQAYVLIFGLDVLGNPFGLVSDFSQNLTDLFYDPLIGYFKRTNNEEHMRFEMGTKIKNAVNNTISSASSSGSLITGSIGRVFATCSFDKEYKRKRQYKLSKSLTISFKDSLTLAGKGIVSGLIYGITGILRQPIEETQKQGKKGLFKGIGKGKS